MTVYEQCEKCEKYFEMDVVNYFAHIGLVCPNCAKELIGEVE